MLKMLPVRMSVLALLVFAGCGSGKPQGGPPPESFRTAPGGLVKDLKVANGKEYRWIPFQQGYPLFIDRDYFYGAVPEKFAGLPLLLTACDDKMFPADKTLVSFTARQPIRVYVLHSAVLQRGPLGKVWLNEGGGWREEPWSVVTTMETVSINRRLVRSRAFAAGELVKLGGPGCLNDACETFGVVVTTDP